MIKIRQIFSTNIVQGLENANQPSASNPFLTAADADAGGTTGNYGAFYDTTDQAALVINTPTPITLNTTYLFDGITIGAPTSRIVIANYGIYNVQFSAQLHNASAAIQTVTFWLRKNGVDIPNSAKDVTIAAGASEYTADWSWLAEANPTDYFEVIFSTPDLLVTLEAIPAAGLKPDIPSLLVVVTQGSKGVVGEIEEAEYKFFGAAPQTTVGASPVTLTVNTITYPVKASVVDGRSRRIVYQLAVFKSGASASTIQFEALMGGLTINVPLASLSGASATLNYIITIYMNFRVGNNIEAIVRVERDDPTDPHAEVESVRGFGTWDKAIINTVRLDFIKATGSAAVQWTFEAKQITSELI